MIDLRIPPTVEDPKLTEWLLELYMWLANLHINQMLPGSVAWDAGSIADGDEAAKDITITGAALGDYVLVSAPYDLQGITYSGYVRAANAVRIRLQNETGGTIDLASGTWKVVVSKQ